MTNYKKSKYEILFLKMRVASIIYMFVSEIIENMKYKWR